MSTWIGTGALLALLLAASAVDLRSRRIPNVLVVTGALIGLGLQATWPAGRGLFDPAWPGAIGLNAALLATVALLAAGALLWRAGLFGAGDAKLLAALGPYIGPAGVLPVLLYTLLAGGVLALAVSAWRTGQLWLAARTPAPAAPAAIGALRLPYALAIAAGALAHVAPGVLALARSGPSGTLG
jgi:prepilin peptidase CpaA